MYTLCLFIQHRYLSICMSCMFLIWVGGILFSGLFTSVPLPSARSRNTPRSDASRDSHHCETFMSHLELNSSSRVVVDPILQNQGDIARHLKDHLCPPKEKSAMASTPSASALSAVLRCQGNILARKRANKTRPAASVYGLGMKSSDRSYFRALLGYLFHWEKLEIPGVLSVSTQFKTRCSRQSAAAKDLFKNSLVSKNPSKTKLKSDCYGIAFQSEQYIVPQGNLVFRVGDTHLRKIISEYPRTFCVSIVCASSKSTLNSNETDSLFPLGLLSLLKNRLMCLTAAVSDIVRTKLGIDRTNQIDPDCDKLSGCVQYSTEDHMEAESETWQGEAPEPKE